MSRNNIFLTILIISIQQLCLSQEIIDDPSFSYTDALADPTGLIGNAIKVENKAQIIVLGGNYGVIKIDSLGRRVNSYNSGYFQPYGFNSQSGSFVDEDSNVMVFGNFEGYQGFSSRHIIRLLPNGMVDQSFSSQLTSNYITVEALNEYPDGKYILSLRDQSLNITIIRLNHDGSIDPTFTSPYPVSNLQTISEFLIQSDGSALIIFENFIQKIDYNGTIDNTYNSATVGSLGSYEFSDSQLLSDGKVLYLSNNKVYRLLPNGGVDNTFPTITIPTSTFYAKRIVQTNDNKFYVYGRKDMGVTPSSPLIKRYDLDGNIDNSFDLAPGFNNETPGTLGINSLVAFDDGTISVVGSFDYLNNDVATNALALDNSGNPIWTHKTGSGVTDYWATVIHVDANNNIFIGGEFTAYNGSIRNDITKLTNKGHTDYSFKPGTGFAGRVSDIVTQPDGKIIVCGQFSSYNGTSVNRIVRLNPNGTIDNTFNTGSGINGGSGEVTSLAWQSDGKLIVAGDFSSYNGQSTARIIRLLPDGSRDLTFTPLSGPNAKVLDIIVKSNDEILICGEFNSYAGTTRARIALLNSNGTLNTLFVPIAAYSLGDIRSMAIQNDGKIVVGGNFDSYIDHVDRRIGRLNSDGSVDSSFVPNAANYNFPEAIGILPDGKIIIGCGTISILESNGTMIANNSLTLNTGVNDIYINPSGNPILVGQFTLSNSKYGISRLKLVPAIHHTEVIQSCEPYIWIDGNLYSSNNSTATYTYTDEDGVDSIVHLDLTIATNYTLDIQIACDSYTWIDGITYYSSTNTPTFTLQNAIGCDSIITLDLTIVPDIPLVVENVFSMSSDANACVGEFAIDISGNSDFELDFDNGSQIIPSTGYSLVTGLCAGVHDLHITDNCGDTLSIPVVIPVDSNYVFTNPFIDSLAQDSLGTTLEDCDIYYAGIDTAYIDSIWANGNTVNVIWNIVDSNGSNLDTTTYELNNGNGVYWLQLSVFCPTKALGDYFTVTEAIYVENGTISTAGLADWEETNMLIYPNPTNDLVTISFDGNEANLTIYDAQGKLIKQSSIHSGEQVSIQNVESGVYFFEIQTEQGKSINRVIKN